MAGNVKGITIEFRGDTTKLERALKQVDSGARSIDSELRKVNRSLKFNPTSIDLWRQKQDLLKQRIAETSEKLRLLKIQQQKVDSGEIKMTADEYRKLQRDIIETSSKLSHFQGQLRMVGNVNLKVVSEKFKSAGASIEAAGQKMRGLSMAAGIAAGSIGALAYKSGSAADDLNTLSKVTGLGTDKLQKYSVAANLVDVSVDTIAKSQIRMTRSMKSAQDGSKRQEEAFKALGISVTNADGSLRNSESVWQDTITALGKMSNETERDALAQTLFGKSAAELNPLIEDQGETYKRVSDTLKKYDLDFVDQQTLDKANQFNDELDTMKVIGSVAISSIGSQLAGYLAPALGKVVEWIGNLANWLSNLSPQVLTVIGIVATVIAVLAPLLIVVGKVATGISAIISLVGVIGPAMGALAGPIGIVIAVVAALIAIGVVLYKNWDTIKAKALAIEKAISTAWNNLKTALSNVMNAIKTGISNAWNAIKTKVTSVVNGIKTAVTTAFNALKSTVATIWNNIKSAITKPIQAAKDKVKSIIDKIKSIFPIKVGNLFGHIDLPHFEWHWKQLTKKIKIPVFDRIAWYANGGIFDSPTIAGIGEAGPEAVVPLDKLWKHLDDLQGGSNVVTINVYGEGQDANEIAEAVRAKLIREIKRNNLAWR